MKELTRKVRINRAKWRSGGLSSGATETGEGVVRLLNTDGFMCCLGFTAKQLGKIKNSEVLGRGRPRMLDCVISPLNQRSEDDILGVIRIVDTKFSNECILVNDDPDITHKQRERKLIRKFNAEGIDLEFFGEYHKPKGNND